MSATHCPFDGCFCQRKENYFLAWQRLISQVGDGSFKINPGAFDCCPIVEEDERMATCSRYKAYQTILTVQQGKEYAQR